MRTKFLTLTTMVVMTGFTAFGQEDKKVKEARKDLAEANQDLIEARADSAADFNKFKKDAEFSINENETKIAALKSKKKKDTKEMNKTYDDKLMALEKKNNTLRKKMQESGKTKTSMWSSFKSEFNHDMSELGQAIRDIGVDNAK